MEGLTFVIRLAEDLTTMSRYVSYLKLQVGNQQMIVEPTKTSP